MIIFFSSGSDPLAVLCTIGFFYIIFGGKYVFTNIAKITYNDKENQKGAR